MGKTLLLLVSFVAVWVLCGLIAAAAVNADLRCEELAESMNARHARRHAGLAFGVGLIGGPVALVTSPVVTGFFYDGFSFRADAWRSPEDRERACGA